MFNKDSYLKQVEHKKGRDETEPEKSCLNAFKIDDEDGIAEAIGFNSNMLNRVDYFLEKEPNYIILLELSDLRNTIEEYKVQLKNTTTEKEKKEFHQACWDTLKNEFIRKWSGSIAVIERLWRKTGKPANDDPCYYLIIICKNRTDIRILDTFKTRLNGMMGKFKSVQICTTKDLKDLTDCHNKRVV